MISFFNGMKVYVRYNAEIVAPFGKWLTVEKYENGVLYFKGKSPYDAIDCSAASFYGFGNSLAGSTLVTLKKWQIPFAAAAEKMRSLVPENNLENFKNLLPTGRRYAHLEAKNS